MAFPLAQPNDGVSAPARHLGHPEEVGTASGRRIGHLRPSPADRLLSSVSAIRGCFRPHAELPLDDERVRAFGFCSRLGSTNFCFLRRPLDEVDLTRTGADGNAMLGGARRKPWRHDLIHGEFRGLFQSGG